MNAVRDKATLSEKTVQKIAKGEVKKAKRRAPRRVFATKVTSRCWSDDVDPRIVALIREMKIAPDRLEVVGPQEVIIHNPGYVKVKK